MEKALEILGLEMCDAHSIVGGWYFKKIHGKWYFCTSGVWRHLKEEDMQAILSDVNTVVRPTIKVKTSTILRSPADEI